MTSRMECVVTWTTNRVVPFRAVAMAVREAALNIRKVVSWVEQTIE